LGLGFPWISWLTPDALDRVSFEGIGIPEDEQESFVETSGYAIPWPKAFE
jgi:hypothetical protein